MPNWKKVIVSGSDAILNQVTASSGIQLPDQARITLGDAEDLKIYHSGTQSILQDTGTGDLQLKGSAIKIRGTNTGESIAHFTENAGVELYYDSSKTLDVVTGGVDITGSLSVTGSYGAGLGAITASGDIVADGDVIAYNSSDERLKDNIEVIKGSLDKIDGIRGVEFDWNEQSPGWARERGHDIGVIAQEVQKVVPEIVVERKNGFLGVDYKRIIPLLIESIKELKQEIEILKKKVN